MPLQRVRKTERGQCHLQQYQDAYQAVKSGTSIRSAAEIHKVNRMSLFRYIHKIDAAGDVESQNEINVRMGYVSHNRVFNEEQEQLLSKYIQRCAEIYFGLSPKEIRKLAF